MGINVSDAPSYDVSINPIIQSSAFAHLAKTLKTLPALQVMVDGIQSTGVAATAKHFPATAIPADDSHGFIQPHSLERLHKVEFPFRAAIAADVKLVMTATWPSALDGPDAPPATLSRRILHELLRENLGFNGVTVTDALDMQAIRQGDALGEDALRAVVAGADLLLVTSNPDDQRRVHESLLHAIQNGQLDREATSTSVERILSLKRWLAGQPQPDLSIVGCAAHQAVAAEIAERSVTLVRDEAGLLPLQLKPEQRIAAIVPKPIDLTPADTSSYVTPGLAEALREYHPGVDEYILSYAPEAGEIAGLLECLRGYDILILGTLNAYASPS
jgi:beta-N-acetylhexosaminidase